MSIVAPLSHLIVLILPPTFYVILQFLVLKPDIPTLVSFLIYIPTMELGCCISLKGF